MGYTLYSIVCVTTTARVSTASFLLAGYLIGSQPILIVDMSDGVHSNRFPMPDVNGLIFGGGWKLLGVQCLGIISVFGWCMIAGFSLFYVIKHLVGLRVSREEELRGLDIDEHGMEAYAGFQVFTTQ